MPIKTRVQACIKYSECHLNQVKSINSIHGFVKIFVQLVISHKILEHIVHWQWWHTWTWLRTEAPVGNIDKALCCIYDRKNVYGVTALSSN